jgi:hypothetical protein
MVLRGVQAVKLRQRPCYCTGCVAWSWLLLSRTVPPMLQLQDLASPPWQLQLPKTVLREVLLHQRLVL